MMIRRRVTVQVNVHDDFYKKMEEYRKVFNQHGVSLSQPEITRMMSKQLRVPNIPKLDVLGGYYDKRKKR